MMDAKELERRKALCRAAMMSLTPWREVVEFQRAHDPTTMLALYEELEALREVAEAAQEVCRDQEWTTTCEVPCPGCMNAFCAPALLWHALARLAAVREGKA